MKRALIAALVLGLILGYAAGASAAPRSASTAIPADLLAPIPAEHGSGSSGNPSTQTEVPPLRDFTPAPRTKPSVTVPEPQAVSVTPEGGIGTALVGGTASWYCGAGSACTNGYPPSCLCAAAGPALRVGDWRGRQVTVRANGRSVVVRLVDFCQCYGTRVLDLYRVAFARLASPSRGLVRVEVEF